MATRVTNRVAEPLPERTSGIWRNADFLKLWAAQSVSLFGSKVTALAVPLTAALTLRASAVEMGLLAAAGQVPFLLLSLPAGLWTDRLRRRPILVAADLGCALLLLSVPAAAALDRLGMMHLYAVAFGVGALTVLFEVAHYAYVPTLVPRADLVDGNSKLQISHSAADAAGPGLGGLLVGAISAPFALVADAASFLISALLLRSITSDEPRPARASEAGGVGRRMTVGLRALLAHPFLRPIVLASVLSELFGGALAALFVLYATRDLGLGAVVLGLVFAIGGFGAILGALLATDVARRVGVGPAIIGGWSCAALGGLFVPFADGPTPVIVAILAASQVLVGLTGAVANVHQWSLRQAVMPDWLQGRVTAGHRFVVYGAGAIGALGGGVLGSTLGLRRAILICAVGALSGPLWAMCSPLRRLRTMPSAAPQPTATGSVEATR